MPNVLRVDLPTLDATKQLADSLAACLEPPLTVALRGTLGAGKTQFVRFLAGSLGVAADQVTSPTYVLLQAYQGQVKIYHFDFYRLDSPAEVWDLGIDELYEQPCLVLIEWADKFSECLPDDVLTVFIDQSAGGRVAALHGSGPRSAAVLAKLGARLGESL
jgi:tRNA threonylcarbamoyladenosine biosynthesis protein TsaE